MNVLIIGKFAEGQFGFHIADTLNDMGNIVFTYDPTYPVKYHRSSILRRMHQFNNLIYHNLLLTSTFRNFKRKKLYEIVQNNKIDLIICTHDFLYPDEVNTIKEISRAPIVMWFPDAIGYTNKALFMISDYDKIFFQDPYVVHRLKDQYNKKNILYLPECCNPKYHKNVNLNENDWTKYSCDISTYGNPHNYRSFFFNQLTNYNYIIKIWGHQPPVWLKSDKLKTLYKGEYLINEEKAKAVLASKINLNTLVPGGINGLNARTFEIAGIGGFQILHWRRGLSDLFEDGKELLSFNTFDELLEKINYYLPKDELRKEIAFAGQKHAYKEHTYSHRLNILFDTVFGSAKGFETPLIKNLKNYQ